MKIIYLISLTFLTLSSCLKEKKFEMVLFNNSDVPVEVSISADYLGTLENDTLWTKSKDEYFILKKLSSSFRGSDFVSCMPDSIKKTFPYDSFGNLVEAQPKFCYHAFDTIVALNPCRCGDTVVQVKFYILPNQRFQVYEHNRRSEVDPDKLGLDAFLFQFKGSSGVTGEITLNGYEDISRKLKNGKNAYGQRCSYCEIRIKDLTN